MGFTVDKLFGEPPAGAPPRAGFPELLLSAVGSASTDARSPIARGLGAFSGVLGQQLGTERTDPQANFIRQLQAIPFEPVEPTRQLGPASLSATINQAGAKTSEPPKLGRDILVPPPPATNFADLVSRVRPGQERIDRFSLAGPSGIGVSAVHRPPRPVILRPGDIPGVQGPGGKVQQTGPQIPPSKLRTPTTQLIVNKEGRYVIQAIDENGAVSFRPTGEFAQPKGTPERQSSINRKRVMNLTAQFDTVQSQLTELRKNTQPPRALMQSVPAGPKRDKLLQDWRADRQKGIAKLVNEIRNISFQINKITKANPAVLELKIQQPEGPPRDQASILERGRQIAGG